MTLPSSRTHAVRVQTESTNAHKTLESLSNPIRRLILQRLAVGPGTFTQTMMASHLNDSSKTAFHLNSLTESGLIVHSVRGPYRLTPRGKGAIKILKSINGLYSVKRSRKRSFP
jgi:Mn-dependent DtxR family transcriptional regulator